jgi:diacylglycerol O-acyltransferase
MTIDRLGAEERVMVDASRAWPQDIGALALLDGRALFDDHGRFRLEAVRGVIGSRLHLVPRFRQVLRTPRRGRGGPFWADAPGFDLAHHVNELRLEVPVGEAGLLRAVEELRAQRFQRRHPLWAMWCLTGLPHDRVAIFVKLHHSIADGMAAMTIISTLLDRTADARPEAPRSWTPAPGPAPADLVADNLRRRLAALVRTVALLCRPDRMLAGVRAAWPAVRELLADEPGAKTSLDRLVGQGRNLALVRADYLPLRRVARAHGATVNDVLLSVTAAGIRTLLIGRGEPVEGVTTRIYVPVSLRRDLRGAQQGSHIAQMAVPLPLGAAAPAVRLQRIAAETRSRKARPRQPLGTLFRGGLATRLLLTAVIRQRVNATSASIPGPKRRLYLAGAPVLEVFPVIPLIGNQPLGIGAVSYAGTLGIGITADLDTIPDLDVFAGGVREELEALGETARSQREPGQSPAARTLARP